MVLDRSSLDVIPISFASCSIGCKPEHKLVARLEALSKAGFHAIELSMPDLISFASDHFHEDVQPSDFDILEAAAKTLLSTHLRPNNIKVMMLQPFANFEGWPDQSPERQDAFNRARGWIRIMLALGTDMLQVGSSDTPATKIGSDRTRFVCDLRELADMLSEHDLRLAYENWCWSSHAPNWADVWNIVSRADRANIGLCLDTFQTAGGEWADPTRADGLVAAHSHEDREATFAASLRALTRTVPPDKIFLLQISDAYKPPAPLASAPDAESGLMPRGRWSHDFRPLPFGDGYLPVVQVAKAVLGTGFRGWFSYEVFDGGPNGQGRDYELDEFANEAFRCHKRLLDECCND